MQVSGGQSGQVGTELARLFLTKSIWGAWPPWKRFSLKALRVMPRLPKAETDNRSRMSSGNHDLACQRAPTCTHIT